MTQLGALWVYLAATPLLGLTMTLFAYLIAHGIYARARFSVRRRSRSHCRSTGNCRSCVAPPCRWPAA
jgi:hypothetical protein